MTPAERIRIAVEALEPICSEFAQGHPLIIAGRQALALLKEGMGADSASDGGRSGASAPPEGVRVGEQLRCIHGNRDFLREGRVYTVREVWAGDLVGLTIWPGHLFGLWRFSRDAAAPLSDPQEAPSGWRPIESAPVDVAVLTYDFSYEVGHFNTALKKWVDCWEHRPIAPTHWMPLPSPPVLEKGDG